VIINTKDPIKIKILVPLSYKLKKLILKNGPCQPNSGGKKNYKCPLNNGRHFRPEWFAKIMQDGTVIKRDWPTYPVSEDKVYCMSCMLTG